ncbi:MAG TPA: GNAT family N-acetyltransferase/peptidase C39 family protein, partial [Motiliproteus sp.]
GVASDLEALLALENRCFVTDKLSRRSLRHFLRGLHSCCFVAEHQGLITGYILLLFRRGSSLARIYSLAVDPDFRGQGIASRLMRAAECSAAEQHCMFIRLEVREENHAAIALYLADGYLLFDEEPDYYEDGAKALRLEKALTPHSGPRLKSSVFYMQTTPFTCGPSSLMMAMHSLNPDSCKLSRRTEMQLWREATTIFMTSGHGGCSPEGLALSAWQRGFAVTLYMQCNDIPFIEGVRDARKKKVIKLVHDDFVDQMQETDIDMVASAITPAQFQQHIDAGDALITLISTWRLNRNKAPHWVFITDSDEQCVYLNDPDPDEDSPHPFHDSIHLPIGRGDFERMACFGSSRLKATLVLRNRNPVTA